MKGNGGAARKVALVGGGKSAPGIARLVLPADSRAAGLQRAAQYLNLYERVEVLEAKSKALKLEMEQLAGDVEVAIKNAGGEIVLGERSLSVSRLVYASVPAGHEAFALQALEALGWGDLIKRTVNNASLSARYRRALADRVELGGLPAALNVTEKRSITIRKAA